MQQSQRGVRCSRKRRSAVQFHGTGRTRAAKDGKRALENQGDDAILPAAIERSEISGAADNHREGIGWQI